MNTKFEKGDIVKFINPNNIKPDYLHNIVNIYRIVSIDGNKVIVNRSFSPNIETELSFIEGIKIDGKEDRNIYYDPVVAAYIVLPGEPVPLHHTNYTYYLDNKSTFMYEGTMRDIVSKKGFTQVHQLQHYLREHFQTDDLKIKG